MWGIKRGRSGPDRRRGEERRGKYMGDSKSYEEDRAIFVLKRNHF